MTVTARSQWRPALLAAGLVLWVALPILVIGAVSRVEDRRRLDVPVTTWVPLVDRVGTSSAAAGLYLHWTAPVSVPAPRWNGLVEAVMVKPRQLVRNGDQLVVVGGVTRIAYHSDRPFGRPLRMGDSGRDVRALHTLLRTLNLPAGRSEEYDNRTNIGVTELGHRLGAQGEVKAFDPSWVVYLSQSNVTVSKVDITVGTEAPSIGTPVILGSGSLRSAELITGKSLEAAESKLQTMADAEQSTSDLSDVIEKTDAPSGSTLSVAGEQVPLGRGRQAVDRSGLAAVESVVTPGSRVVRAELERPATKGEFEVPAAAVFAGADGSTCVLARLGQESARPVIVTVVDASASYATVRGALVCRALNSRRKSV